jgi:hypothetical protein
MNKSQIFKRLPLIIVITLWAYLWFWNPLEKNYIPKIIPHITFWISILVFFTLIFLNDKPKQREAMSFIISLSLVVFYLLFSPDIAVVLGISLVVFNIICCVGLSLYGENLTKSQVLKRLPMPTVFAIGVFLWLYNPLEKNITYLALPTLILPIFILSLYLAVIFVYVKQKQRITMVSILFLSLVIYYLFFSPGIALVLGISLVVLNIICSLGMFFLSEKKNEEVNENVTITRECSTKK